VELFPLVILVLAFVLLIVVPARQRKKLQEQQRTLQESLTPGTPVMTTAGLHGTVAALGEGTVDLEIAPGVVVTFARQAVLEVRNPAVADTADGTAFPGDDGNGTADGGPADRTR
jgi:preprotein translocase subunit YajC